MRGFLAWWLNARRAARMMRRADAHLAAFLKAAHAEMYRPDDNRSV